MEVVVTKKSSVNPSNKHQTKMFFNETREIVCEIFQWLSTQAKETKIGRDATDLRSGMSAGESGISERSPYRSSSMASLKDRNSSVDMVSAISWAVSCLVHALRLEMDRVPFVIAEFLIIGMAESHFVCRSSSGHSTCNAGPLVQRKFSNENCR